MKKYSFMTYIRMLTFILSIHFMTSSCTKDDDPVVPPTDIVAPEFTLSSLDGAQIKLSDYSNKVVVLFFFGNNCPSCKAAAPGVQSMLVDAFASNNDYQLLGLDQWDGNTASLQAFKTATGVSFPLLLNASGVAADYKTTYDRLVVIGKDGKIVYSGTTVVSADIESVKQKVEILLGVQPDTTSGDTKVTAPEFSLTSLSGGDVKLSDHKGKVVVLFFFGNNCPPCKAAAPNIESKLVTPFASRADYQILGLDQWNGNSTVVQAFKTATGVSFPLLLNASDVASDYKTTYDRLVVINKDGKIDFLGTRGASADIEDVKQKVEMLF